MFGSQCFVAIPAISISSLLTFNITAIGQRIVSCSKTRITLSGNDFQKVFFYRKLEA